MSSDEALTRIKVAAHESPILQGKWVDLAEAAKYEGQRLGYGKLKGECATGVQYVFIKASNPLGLTRTWKPGVKVRGNNIKPGTAIASFRNGAYTNDHAAIFINETDEGIWVWDQYNRPQKAWGKRLLKFKDNDDHSNNGNLFYTIQKK